MNNFNNETKHTPNNELTSVDVQKTKEAVETLLLEHDPQTAAKFLKENPECVHEFCMQIIDKYQEQDKYTPILEISDVMAELLK